MAHSLSIRAFPMISAALGFLLLPSHADARTLTLAGSMRSAGSFTEQMEIMVSEPLQSLKLEIPTTPQHDVVGQTSAAAKLSLVSRPVATSQATATDSQGNSYSVLTFNSLKPGKIVVQATYSGVDVDVDLSKPIPKTSLPLQNVPADAAAYLKASPLVQSDDPAVKSIAASLLTQSHDEASLSGAILSYLQTTLAQGSIRSGIFKEDAKTFLSNKTGGVVGITHAFIAIARAAGIPARIVVGPVVSGELSIPLGTQNGDVLVRDYEGGRSVWAEIWFPNAGWVVYGAPVDLGYLDSFHIPAAIGRDFGDIAAQIQIVASHPNSLPPNENDTDFSTTTMTNKQSLKATDLTSDAPLVLLLSRAVK